MFPFAASLVDAARVPVSKALTAVVGPARQRMVASLGSVVDMRATASIAVSAPKSINMPAAFPSRRARNRRPQMHLPPAPAAAPVLRTSKRCDVVRWTSFVQPPGQLDFLVPAQARSLFRPLAHRANSPAGAGADWAVTGNGNRICSASRSEAMRARIWRLNSMPFAVLCTSMQR